MKKRGCCLAADGRVHFWRTEAANNSSKSRRIAHLMFLYGSDRMVLKCGMWH